MLIQISLKNEFGEFYGEKREITTDQYEAICKIGTKFYESGFELNCEDGSFMVFPPEIVKKSVLKVSIIK